MTSSDHKIDPITINTEPREDIINIMDSDTDERIKALLKMPPLAKAELFRFVGTELQQFKTLDPELYQPLVGLHKVLSTRFYYYDVDSHGQHFAFPETKFEHSKGERLVTSAPRPVEQEDTFKEELTAEQKQQIWNKGTFDVPSKISKTPYRWRVHPYIVKGSQNVTETWYKMMAVSYHQIRQVQKRIAGETLSLKLNISEFKHYPIRIVNMLVGVKMMRVAEQPDYDRLVQMRFMLHKFQQFYSSEPHELNEALKVPIFVGPDHASKRHQEDVKVKVSQQLNELQNIDNRFEQDWVAVQRQMTRQYKQEATELKEEELTDILQKEKQKRYDAWLKEKLPEKLQDNIFYLLRIFTTFQVLMAKMNSDKDKARTRIQQDIKQKHKIRSRDEYFWQEEIDRQYAPIEKAINDEYIASLRSSLSSKLFDEYLQFRKDFDSQVEKLKAKLPITYAPRRTFYTRYRLFPPYEKIQDRSSSRWSLKKHEDMECDTGHHFWKISLYKMRLYSWTRNCFFWLVANSWVGPFGLRVILSINQFQVDQNINYYSGEMNYTYQDSLIIQFNRVLEGIKNSRAYFESQPDTGFFGKKFSRIFNLIECYIFRFLIVGIIIVLILYPIAIVLNSVISFVLAITSWIWVPLVEIVCYLFNILIYQFEIDDSAHGNRYSERWFPLISTPLMFVLNILRIIGYMIGAAVVHPLISVFFLVFAVLQHIWATTTDFIMFNVVKLLARTPNRDTNIAWKISGPDLSRNYYDSISGQNIYLLVQANLQRCYVSEYCNQMRQKIQEPVRILEDTMRRAMSVFEAYPSMNRDANIIYKSTQELEKQFNAAYMKYLQRYPFAPNVSNVRFTQEELDAYLDNCNRIVRKFIQSRNCLWIFGKKGLEVGDYEELTKMIFREIFSHSVLEPFEDLDNRFELIEAEGGRQRRMIINALKGEVQLNEFRPSTTRQYKLFRIGSIEVYSMNNVVNAVHNITNEYVSTTHFDMQQSVLINPHIGTIAAHDAGSKRYDKYRPELFE